jgi:hypothetical protein
LIGDERVLGMKKHGLAILFISAVLMIGGSPLRIYSGNLHGKGTEYIQNNEEELINCLVENAGNGRIVNAKGEIVIPEIAIGTKLEKVFQYLGVPEKIKRTHKYRYSMYYYPQKKVGIFVRNRKVTGIRSYENHDLSQTDVERIMKDKVNIMYRTGESINYMIGNYNLQIIFTKKTKKNPISVLKSLSLSKL